MVGRGYGRGPAMSGRSRADLGSPGSRHSHGRIATPHSLLRAWPVVVVGRRTGKALGRGRCGRHRREVVSGLTFSPAGINPGVASQRTLAGSRTLKSM